MIYVIEKLIATSNRQVPSQVEIDWETQEAPRERNVERRIKVLSRDGNKINEMKIQRLCFRSKTPRPLASATMMKLANCDRGDWPRHVVSDDFCTMRSCERCGAFNTRHQNVLVLT